MDSKAWGRVIWNEEQGGVMHFRRGMFLLFFSLLPSYLMGCSTLLKKKEVAEEHVSTQLAQKPLPPENAEEVLSEIGESWLYGPGLGQTALNVGAMVVFPPYAIYVVGNSILSMSGYEPLYVTDLLPDSERAEVNDVYDEVTTAPGRVSAAIAGKEFRSREVAAARLKAIVSKGAASPKVKGKKVVSRDY